MAIKMPKRQESTQIGPDEFIAGATAAPPSPTQPPAEDLPWRHPRVRDDLRVQVNSKLPEKLMIQRDWLAARLGLKKQDILEIALRGWVEKELRNLGLDKD
jgi:hypothetical protein